MDWNTPQGLKILFTIMIIINNDCYLIGQVINVSER